MSDGNCKKLSAIKGETGQVCYRYQLTITLITNDCSRHTSNALTLACRHIISAHTMKTHILIPLPHRSDVRSQHIHVGLH